MSINTRNSPTATPDTLENTCLAKMISDFNQANLIETTVGNIDTVGTNVDDTNYKNFQAVCPNRAKGCEKTATLMVNRMCEVTNIEPTSTPCFIK